MLTVIGPLAVQYAAVAGTHGARTALDWSHPHSPFAQALRGYGCSPLRDDPRACFEWSTALDGIDDQHLDWQFAGKALYRHFVPALGDQQPTIPPSATNILCFSHGLQVVAYACGEYGLQVNGLISVGSPIRGDLLDLYARAASNIRRHLHLHARKRDFWQVAGALFDGRWGIHRQHPFAKNVGIPDGHGAILRDPKLFPLWRDLGWLRTFEPPKQGVRWP